MKMYVEKDGEVKQIQTESYSLYQRRGWKKTDKTETQVFIPKKGKKRIVEEPEETPGE